MVFISGIICDPARDRICQFSLKYLFSSEHIRDAVSTLYAALPCVDHCLDLRTVLHKAHIDDIRHIQHHDHVFKMTAHTAQHFCLCPCQVIAALLGSIVLVLTRSSSDHHNCLVRYGSGFCGKLLRQRHLLLAPRLACPSAPAVVKRMCRDPLFIAGCQFFIYPDAGIPKPIQQIRCVPYIHCTARSGPASVVLLLTSPKYRCSVI